MGFPIGTKSLSPSVFEIFGSKYIGVTTLTFWGHATLLVMWPFDAPYSLSYKRFIVTDSLSPSVFEIFGSKYIGVTTLTFWGHVTLLVIWPFDDPYCISYRRSIVTDFLSSAVFEILGRKHIGVTWRHRSREDSIPHIGFPIGATLEPSFYLHVFSRYLAPNISGSRHWPFGVTWRHWSCDHFMPHIAFPIGVPL